MRYLELSPYKEEYLCITAKKTLHEAFIILALLRHINFYLNKPILYIYPQAWWRNGSASDSRSEGCVFKSRPGHVPISFFLCINYVICTSY